MCECNENGTARRRGGFLGTLFQVALLYVILVFGGGTLIGTGHPVAVEVGKLIHTITFVQPSTQWAVQSGYPHVAGGLRFLAHGFVLS